MNDMNTMEEYVANRLSEDEKRAFEAYLEQHPELQKEVELRQDLKIAIQESERKRLKADLQQWASQKGARISSSKKIYLIILAIIIAIVLVWVYSIVSDQQDNEKELYATYYKIYPNDYQPTVRGTDTSPSIKGFAAYESMNYDVAASEFTKSLSNDYDPSIAFFRALCLNEIGNKNEAIKELDQLKSIDFRYHPEVYYYLGLFSLEAQNMVSAKDHLKKYLQISDNTKRKEKARNLLKALEHL